MVTADKEKFIEYKSLLMMNAEVKNTGIVSFPIYKHLGTKLLSKMYTKSNSKIYDHVRGKYVEESE